MWNDRRETKIYNNKQYRLRVRYYKNCEHFRETCAIFYGRLTERYKNRQPTTTATQCVSEAASAAAVAAAALVATEPLKSTKTTDADTAITDWRVSTTRADDDGGNAGRSARSDGCRTGPTVTSRAARAWSGRHSVTPTPGYGHITHPRPPPTVASTAPDHFFDRRPPIFLRDGGKGRRAMPCGNLSGASRRRCTLHETQ